MRLLLAALLLSLAQLCGGSHASTPRFRASPLFQPQRTVPATLWGDLADPAFLRAVVAERVYRREVILSTFGGGGTTWLEWAAHVERGASHVGYSHLLLLGTDEAACVSLRDYYATAFAEPAAAVWPGCAWATLPGGGAETYERGLGVWVMWIRRYYAAYLFLGEGVNVLLADLDVSFGRDFYEEAHLPPFSTFNLFVMPNEINGGLWYTQRAAADGAVRYLLNETITRALLLFQYRAAHAEGNTPGQLPPSVSDMDQFLFAELLSTLAVNASRFFWPSLVAATPELPGYTPGGNKPHTWPWREVRVSPPRAAPPATGAPPSAFAAFNDHDREMLFAFPIWKPPELRASAEDEREEWVVRAPDFLFDVEQAILFGWQSPGVIKPAYAAVSHLVATTHCYAGPPCAGVTAPAGRRHFLMAHRLWRGAFPPTPPTLISLSPTAVAAAAAAHTETPLRALIAGLMRAAAHTGRTPLLPSFPCALAPWLPRSNRSAHGFHAPSSARWAIVLEPRVVVDGEEATPVAMCSPYLSGGACPLGEGGVWFHHLPNHHQPTCVEAETLLKEGKQLSALWIEMEGPPPPALTAERAECREYSSALQ